MPPAKSKTANHDDSKSETLSVKERIGHGANKDHGHQTNGKLRRVASSTGSTLRDATKATTNGHPPVTTEAPAAQPAATPAVCMNIAFSSQVVRVTNWFPPNCSCTGLRSTARSSTSIDANTISTLLPHSPTATAGLSLVGRESVFTPLPWRENQNTDDRPKKISRKWSGNTSMGRASRRTKSLSVSFTGCGILPLRDPKGTNWHHMHLQCPNVPINEALDIYIMLGGILNGVNEAQGQRIACWF